MALIAAHLSAEVILVSASDSRVAIGICRISLFPISIPLLPPPPPSPGPSLISLMVSVGHVYLLIYLLTYLLTYLPQSSGSVS